MVNVKNYEGLARQKLTLEIKRDNGAFKFRRWPEYHRRKITAYASKKWARRVHFTQEPRPKKLTYAASPPIAALIMTEALFAAACNVAELKWL